MTNFAFMPSGLSTVRDAAAKAESYILSDPRSACFHARFALETAVHWLYRHDNRLRMPYDRSLGALIHEPSFQNILPEPIFPKIRLIQRIGNQAVHEQRSTPPVDGLRSVKELHHLGHWLTRTYFPDAPRDGFSWSDNRVPRPLDASKVVPRKELLRLHEKLEKDAAERLKVEQERDALSEEIRRLRDELAKNRQAAEAQTDDHDYNEAETREYLIDVELRRAGWTLEAPRDREFTVDPMPDGKKGRADYVLWGDDGKPLAVVEAKRTTVDADAGRRQAELYAQGLETMFGRRPLIFYTNGHKTGFWDDHPSFGYPPRAVSGFYTKDELERLIRRRDSRQALATSDVKDTVAGRYYQKRAIGKIFEHFLSKRRKALLVMATGTGKTRTAIALVDVLQRSNWIKRALFLADRRSLVRQAAKAFKTHLPDSSPVDLLNDKEADGRVYLCTYPTMMGLIDEKRGESNRFGVGFFDLVIIDEAHRSVYKKYGEIFRYFDSLLVGLTATPKDEVDRDTYGLFDLEQGVPTDAYELDKAVADGFLVFYDGHQVDMRFPRRGIDYEALSEEEKEQWDTLDWGDAEDDERPDRVDAGAVNNWLFNEDTVDQVLRYVMENGHKVDGGDRLGKTIVFARNQRHAEFIERRFNVHYPEFAGKFARIVSYKERDAQGLIDDFSIADKAPHIAISVDMLDTGIDVPEILNLVFFKPVYSKTKFWQMVGRGTRTCEDLFGPGDHKQDFRLFDFCGNLDFFRANPEGVKRSGSRPSLSTRLFQDRVELLGLLLDDPALDPDAVLADPLRMALQREVAGMNADNFIVRDRLQAVDRFRRMEDWQSLSSSERQTLKNEVAGLPSAMPTDDVRSRELDALVLKMQLAWIQGGADAFGPERVKILELAALLETRTGVPAVADQVEYLEAIQDPGFWDAISLDELEEMRVVLRRLVPFITHDERKIVYTTFQDEILEVRAGHAPHMPKMTGVQYEKKVRDYLRNHLDHLVIHRLRTHKPLTATDLQSLETTLEEIGEDDGPVLLSGLLAKSGAPSLVHFVRGLVGMDRAAAQQAFSRFLSDRSLTARQIQFIELIVDQLTARGVMEAGALYESPFHELHSGGPDALFAGKDNVIDGIFDTLESLQPETLAG